jgi:hypothetical protein
MKRILFIAVFASGGVLVGTSRAPGQITIRTPFVRVQIGPGVSVQAPGVNLYVPPRAPAVVVQPPGAPPAGANLAPLEVLPPPGKLAPAAKGEVPGAVPPAPLQPPAGKLAPAVKGEAPGAVPPAPLQPPQLPTLEQFASSFKPKAGSYEVDLINPVSKQPTKVRFTLPEGTPTKVQVRPHEIEFRYGIMQFVRIEFDKDGAQVVTRTAR